MMSACYGTEIASMRAAVGEKIVGRQLEFGRTAFQLYIYIYDDDDDELTMVQQIQIIHCPKYNDYYTT